MRTFGGEFSLEVPYCSTDCVVDEERKGVAHNGRLSREGLMLLDAEVEEPVFNLDDIEVEDIQEDVPYVVVGDVNGFLSSLGDRVEFDFYNPWYMGGGPSLRSKDATGSSLMIHDSYGESLRWLIAKNYVTTQTVGDLCRIKSNKTISGLVDELEIDDIYFVALDKDYATFSERNPDYFSG